ncbi:MAG: amidohydrolase [Lachnospiraceae bacterium]|nr:amidohydrolase [Lachnospiraceae bacterium]
MKNRTLTEAEALRGKIIGWRRAFHQIPELQGETVMTEALISETLHSIGIEEVRTGVGGHGVTALIRGALPGKCLAIRADCDALPIREETGLPFASENGNMHACGHDAHTAMALGAAALLWARKAELRGTVKFIFQPYEEGGRGALSMIRDGVLTDPKVDAMIALHIGNIMGAEYESGDVVHTAEPASANIYGFKAVFRGKGTHLANLSDGINPLFMASRAALRLEELRLEALKAGERVASAVTVIQGGTRNNIVPDTAEIQGSIRSFDREKHKAFIARFQEECGRIAAEHGGSVFYETMTDVPCTINDPKLHRRFTEIASRIISPEHMKALKQAPLMGEDYSYFSELVPSLYFYYCSKPADGPCYPHHHPKFDISEKTLPLGAALFTEFALQWQK